MTSYRNLALITCFFGKLPWYFDYFAHSCGYNPTVDFLIITDDHTYDKPLPSNIKVIYRTLDQVTALASEKIGFQVNIGRGYKMCDFKPAYGVIFSDYLANYDFWGHTDIDIVFGDIREFITDDLLQNYDLISVRPDWLTGCFLLYRNNPKLNTLFEQSKDYRKVFTSPVHYCFDETNFAHDAFSEGKPYTDIKTEIESMMHVVQRLEAEHYLKPYFELHIIEGLPGKLRWENGKMFYRNKYEILLYHMIYFKNKPAPLKTRTITDAFTISPTKIYHQKISKQLTDGV
ncbi:MAG: hypothetical protein JST32_20550 [Bacteroidetes bacterium]|nr:hypothetical protein [Bacteroidota bacterium]